MFKYFKYDDIFPLAFVLILLFGGGYLIGNALYTVIPDFWFVFIMVVWVCMCTVMLATYIVSIDKRKYKVEAQPEKPKYEIEKVLILSTGHVSQFEFETMTVDDEMPFRTIEHEYGVILIMSDFEDEEAFEQARCYMVAHFPKLWKVTQFAKGLGCRYVNFDRDGEIYELLPQYDW